MITDYDNCLDDKVDEELLACLNLQNPKSFFLFAGAGSGKTRSLVNVLEQIKDKYGDELKRKHPIKYTLYFHKIENSISTLVKS